MRVKLAVFFVMLLLALPAPTPAQQSAARTLDVPASAAWRHARTELILPPLVDGLTRTAISDLGSEERDVVAQYENRDEGLIVTVYLYQTGVPDVPLWFDRALTALVARPEYGLAGAPAPTPSSFARPGAANASGLLAAADLATGSTAVAIAPLGSFQLKIRFTAGRLDRAALAERLARFVAGLRWPAETAHPAPAAVPVEPCPAPLQLRNARLLRPDMTDSILMGALIGAAANNDDNDRPAPVYCREPGATVAYGVYRANAATDAYLIALNDAGIAYSVGETLDFGALTGQGSRGRRYSVTLLARNATGVVASFNRLPPPAQAMSVAERSGPQIITTFDPPAGN